MALARYEKTIQDSEGTVNALLTSLQFTVRKEEVDGNPLADIFSDRDGAVPLGNPASVVDGVVAFHVTGGVYQIRVYGSGYDKTFRYVGIGTAQERDIVEGTGDVTGPDDSLDGELAVFDLTTGKQLKRGGLLSTAWAAMTHALTAKTTPVDADELGIVDSAASNAAKRLTFANLATWIGTKLGPLINAATDKATPVNADMLAVSDSAASNVTKKVTLTNFKAFLKTYFDTVYQAIGGGLVLLTEQATTSGSTVDFTIPAGAKRVVLMLNAVSANSGGEIFGIQLGDAGGIETTGYLSQAGSSASTDRFRIQNDPGANQILHGSIILTRVNGTHTWVAQGNIYDSVAGSLTGSAGNKTLSAELTTVRLTCGGTLDGGTANVTHE